MSWRRAWVPVACCVVLAAGGCGSDDDGSSSPDAGDAQPSCSDGARNGDEEGVDCGGSCEQACAECSGGQECPSGLCVDGVCATSQTVSCRDAAPDHATSMIEDVVIEYSEAEGWETAPACDWSCDAAFCEADGQCVSAVVEIRNELPEGSGLGAVNLRVTNGVTQSRGTGQSFTATEGFQLEQLAVKVANSSGAELDVLVQLRAADGTELARTVGAVPGQRDRDWLWFDLSHKLVAGDQYIVTLHVPDGLAGGVGGAASVYVVPSVDSYAGGPRYSGITTDETARPLDQWTSWSAPQSDDLEIWVRSAPRCEQ